MSNKTSFIGGKRGAVRPARIWLVRLFVTSVSPAWLVGLGGGSLGFPVYVRYFGERLQRSHTYLLPDYLFFLISLLKSIDRSKFVKIHKCSLWLFVSIEVTLFFRSIFWDMCIFSDVFDRNSSRNWSCGNFCYQVSTIDKNQYCYILWRNPINRWSLWSLRLLTIFLDVFLLRVKYSPFVHWCG